MIPDPAAAIAILAYDTTTTGDTIVVTMRQFTGDTLLDPVVYTGIDALNRLRRMALIQAAGAKGDPAIQQRAETLAATPISPGNSPNMTAMLDEWRVEQAGSAGATFCTATYRVTVPDLPRRLCGVARGRDAGKAQVRFLDWVYGQIDRYTRVVPGEA